MDRYAHKESYIPLSDTIPHKQVHVSYHFYQLDDSTGNWQDTLAWESMFDQINIWMNDRYINVNPPTNPLLSYALPYTDLVSSKIEIVVDSMYFYPNTSFYNSNASRSELDAWVSNNYPDHLGSLKIHFYPYVGYPGGAGYSVGPNLSSHPGTVVIRQIEPRANAAYFLSGHLVHEIGHSLGLGHTYDTGGHHYFNSMWPPDPITHYQHCDKNSYDFCWDVYDTTLTQSPDTLYNCIASCNTCFIQAHETNSPTSNNNNIMGGAHNRHISPLQMGIMHRTTVLQNVRDFISGNSEIPHVVSTDETWDFSMKFYQDILVESGSTLTIQCEIQMSPENKIIVEPGATLIIDGGVITNEGYYNTFWKGIEVVGNANQPQFEPYQGKVVLTNGGSIENATLGVSLGVKNENGTIDLSTTGGFLNCSNGAKFVNCQRAVAAYDYQGQFYNRTKFYNTTFEINDEFLFDSEPEHQVLLRGVNGVIFQNCTFVNNRTDEFSIFEAGKGIAAFYAGFKVKSCTFENLELGIRVHSLGVDDIKISESNFTGNYGGISLWYSGLAEITENTFNIPPIEQLNIPGHSPDDIAYGLFMGGSTGYEVEENLFYSSSIQKNVGVGIRNSGNHFNQFGFNNEFHTLEAGALVMGDNRYDPAEGATQATGLIFRCNDFGIEVEPGVYGDLNYSIALTDEGEVSMHQGVLTAEVPGAGNRFYPVCPPATSEKEFYVDDSSPELSYHNYIPFAQPETRPDCNTGLPYVGVSASIITFIKEVHCPSDLSSGGVIGVFRDRYYQNKGIYESLLEVYRDTVNGGDTQFLLDLLKDEFVSSFDLRNELLLASPRVTDRVLIAAIMRDPAMNPWHVAQVLLANSPLPQNVLTALNRSDFDGYYKELVEGGQNGGVSNTMIMESELSYFDGLKETARMDFVRQAYRQDSTLALNDSIIHYLSDDADDEQLKLLIAYHLKRGQHQQAEALLTQAPNFKWTPDYTDVISVLVDALNDTALADSLITVHESTLLAVANEHSPEAHLAQSILENYGLAQFNDIIVLPGFKQRSLQVSEDAQSSKRKPLASIQPNPTKGMAYLNWKLPEGMPAQEVSMAVYSIHGHRLLSDFLNAEVGIREINTANWSPGLYLFQLRHDERLIESIRFEVIR